MTKKSVRLLSGLLGDVTLTLHTQGNTDAVTTVLCKQRARDILDGERHGAVLDHREVLARHNALQETQHLLVRLFLR